MARATKARLGDRVEVVVADLHHFTSPEAADVLFPTATLRWGADHARLWRYPHDLPRAGGTLAVQCGGAGDIPGVEGAMAELPIALPPPCTWRRSGRRGPPTPCTRSSGR